MRPEDIELRMTCGACPEQYEAYHQGAMVAYLRLRHGRFTVECPDVGGELVYEATPRGDGIFDDAEREGYLQRAKDHVVAFYTDSGLLEWKRAVMNDETQLGLEEWSKENER